MAEPTRTLATRLRRRRRALGLTQAQLAERAGVSVELVSRVERARCLPSVMTLVRFSEALSTTPNVLLGFESPGSESEVERLTALLRALPPARRREVERVAEALAQYKKRDR